MIDIVSAIYNMKKKKIRRYPCHVNRASSLGYFVPELDGCLRRGVYERTNWRDKEMYDPRVQYIFDEGHKQEASVLRDLAEAGIEVIEQQTPYEWREYQITGHIDGKIIDPDDGQSIPIEIKSMHPNIYGIINSFEDFLKKPWTRAYMAQITLYMLMQNIDRAIFVLKNKSSGELKQIDVDLDYDLGEYCIRTAENINEHVKKNTLPEQINDREKCRDCPFKLICLPDIKFGEELKIVDDPEFENRLKRHFELKGAAAEYKKNYDVIKSRIKATALAEKNGECNLMVADYQITGKTGGKHRFLLSIKDTQK